MVGEKMARASQQPPCNSPLTPATPAWLTVHTPAHRHSLPQTPARRGAKADERGFVYLSRRRPALNPGAPENRGRVLLAALHRRPLLISEAKASGPCRAQVPCNTLPNPRPVKPSAPCSPSRLTVGTSIDPF
jgi:hypothetical protein